MSVPLFVLAFIGCWSIAVVGGYLAVVGLGNVHHSFTNQAPANRHAHPLMQRGLLVFWDAFLLLLGGLLMVAGMVLLYLLVYG